MAKKAAAGANKSAAIREYKGKNPDAGPKEIAAALANSGVKVSAGFVSTVLSNDKRRAGKGRRRRGGRRMGRPKGTGRQRGDALSKLVLAKKMADQFGGVDQARAALNALAQILG